MALRKNLLALLSQNNSTEEIFYTTFLHNVSKSTNKNGQSCFFISFYPRQGWKKFIIIYAICVIYYVGLKNRLCWGKKLWKLWINNNLSWFIMRNIRVQNLSDNNLLTLWKSIKCYQNLNSYWKHGTCHFLLFALRWMNLALLRFLKLCI